jgi:hypothetical protein
VKRAAALIARVFATLAAAVLTSCDHTPTTPSTAAPPPPPQAVTTRVELIAPRSLAPGASDPLRVTATADPLRPTVRESMDGGGFRLQAEDQRAAGIFRLKAEATGAEATGAEAPSAYIRRFE